MIMRPPKGMPKEYYEKEHRRKLSEKILCSLIQSNMGISEQYVGEIVELSLKLTDEHIKQTK